MRRLPWEPESCAILAPADVDWDYSCSEAVVKVAWSSELHEELQRTVQTVLEPVQSKATEEARRCAHEASAPRDGPVCGSH